MTDYDELQRQQQAAAEMAIAEHIKECNDITELGRNAVGPQFDNDVVEVTTALGSPERIAQFSTALRATDMPVQIIEHLANNPARLAEFSKLPPHRQQVEMARIEGQMNSFGSPRTGHQPMWKNQEVRSGRVSDAEWARTGGQALADSDEAAWHREADRKMAARSEKLFGRVVKGSSR